MLLDSLASLAYPSNLRSKIRIFSIYKTSINAHSDGFQVLLINKCANV